MNAFQPITEQGELAQNSQLWVVTQNSNIQLLISIPKKQDRNETKESLGGGGVGEVVLVFIKVFYHFKGAFLQYMVPENMLWLNFYLSVDTVFWYFHCQGFHRLSAGIQNVIQVFTDKQIFLTFLYKKRFSRWSNQADKIGLTAGQFTRAQPVLYNLWLVIIIDIIWIQTKENTKLYNCKIVPQHYHTHPRKAGVDPGFFKQGVGGTLGLQNQWGMPPKCYILRIERLHWYINLLCMS